MTQIIIRNLPEAVKAKLELRAKGNGWTLAQEAREVLSRAATEIQPIRQEENVPSHGLGTEIAALFKREGFDFEIPELRRHEVKPATFGPAPKKRKKK